jgi:hypothetical protein
MSFADQVKSAIEKAEGQADSEAARRYSDILNELARGLEAQGIGATIRKGADPRKLSLYVHAPYRSSNGSIMLTFFLNGDDLTIVGESPVVISTPEGLETWLLNFVQLPAFIESLHTLRSEGDKPVEARLRVDQNAAYAKGDIVVAVSPEEQRTLWAARIGSQVQLEVQRVDFAGNPLLSSTVQHQVLDSAGLVVKIQNRTFLEGARIKIVGHREI